MSGTTKKGTGRDEIQNGFVRFAMVNIMKKLVIINNQYFQRFHSCNAFYRYDAQKNCYHFISYNTYIMRIDKINGRYIILAYDYKGVTTQKQMSRFIFEFCGYGYYKAYKKAREIMRKNNGSFMVLEMVENFETWTLKLITSNGNKTITFNI